MDSSGGNAEWSIIVLFVLSSILHRSESDRVCLPHVTKCAETEAWAELEGDTAGSLRICNVERVLLGAIKIK